jgi:diacylglycerol kinase family enzyme
VKLRSPKAEKLLVISGGAGTMDDKVEARLRTELADHLVVNFDPMVEIAKLITPRASVVVAGGDGTVEHVVRQLATTDHPVGIIPRGTYNNFAHALGLPDDLDQAIEVIKRGRMRAITLGRVNKHVFLEACAIGLFGDAIFLADAARGLEFDALVEKLKPMIDARPFEYEVSGDLEERGTGMSLVFTNTPSIGMQLPVSDSGPRDPYLEFSAATGQSRGDIVARALASALLSKHEDEGAGRLRFQRIAVRTRPRARVYADNQPAGHTPAVITAQVSALKVLVPIDGEESTPSTDGPRD